MAVKAAPKVPMVSQPQLLESTLEIMEDDLRISKKQARDFVESLRAAIEEALAEGNRVAVLGIVRLNLAYKAAKPRRKGVNPRTGEEATLKAKPASVAVRATVDKRMKDALPSPRSSAGGTLQTVAEARQKAAEARARARAKEEAADTMVKKASGKRKASGKKK